MRDCFFEVLSVIMSLYEGFLAQKLFRLFVEPKARFRRAEYAVGVFWAVLNIILYYVLDNGYYEPIILVRLIIYTFGLVLFSVLWYKDGILQRIFPALLFSAIRELTVQIVNCLTVLNSLSVDILWEMAEKELIPYESLVDTLRLITNTVILILTIVKEVIIYFAVKSIAGNCRSKPRFGKETVMYLLPGAAGLLVSAIIRIILMPIENGYTTIIYQRFPLLYLVVPVTSAGLLVMIIFSFKLYQDITALQREQAEKAVLESQLAGMQSALAEKERLYESMSAVRHDMKNSLSALRGLISRKLPDDEEVNRYFESMSLSVARTESRIHTGNAVCDAIISEKFAAAEAAVPGISLDADGFFFGGEVSAAPYDVGVILSNGLDNALEACKRLKESVPGAQTFITVRSFVKKNFYFAEIENSFDGILKTDEKSGLPVSSKESGGLHGIGLRSIKSCAEKYSGSMELIVRGNRFILSVMMKI